MLRQRVTTALVGIPVLVAAAWYHDTFPYFTLLVALWGVLAALEFYRLVKRTKEPPLIFIGVVWTSLFILSRDSDIITLLKPYLDANLLLPFLLTSAVTFSLINLLIRQRKEQAFNIWAWTMAGILYTGWLLGYLVALRCAPDGRNWVLLALFATFASDTAAFFIGRVWGRRKLEPSISPGKTWEGTLAGIAGAIVVAWLFTLASPFQVSLTGWQAVILGLLVSIFGQLGDLVESLFKRNMGVKDSGKLLPGHGGLLDRMDSVVFAGVLVYYYMLWVAR